MNICDNKTDTSKINPTPIEGHLYYCDQVTMSSFGKVALMTKRFNNGEKVFGLYSVISGELWSNQGPYAAGYNWIDVTDQYCLQKVK